MRIRYGGCDGDRLPAPRSGTPEGPIVKAGDRKRAHGLGRFARCLVLAGVVGVVGCSEPGQGTAQVATEARQRLMPQAGPKATGGKQSPAAGKTFSIKDRGRAAPAEPTK